MAEDVLNKTINNFSWFDTIFLIIVFYNIIKSFIKGFTLSLISFMKWILALVFTIIITPKIQPMVSDYIESPFINSLGLGIFIYILSLFIIILFGKAFSSSVKWTGLGNMDKVFGLLFGIFKGYIVSVCLFSIINWFYPFNNWNIDVRKAVSFKIVNQGSEILINELPKYKDIEDTREKIDNI